jgi:hypothetical protein
LLFEHAICHFKQSAELSGFIAAISSVLERKREFPIRHGGIPATVPISADGSQHTVKDAVKNSMCEGRDPAQPHGMLAIRGLGVVSVTLHLFC